MKRVVGLLLLLAAAGCSSAWRQTEGQWAPGKSLSPNPKVLLLPVLGRDSEDCKTMTDTMLAMLSKRGFHVELFSGKRQSATAALTNGAGKGFDYVLEGVLSKWEDKASGDEAELTVKLFQVSTGEVVATAVHSARGRANHWPSDPADFIPELADCALGKIFGWTPKVYEGDPR